MAPRRAHHKSRSGCLVCKRRRVKCDETGPPCRNCISRRLQCEYPAPVYRPATLSESGKLKKSLLVSRSQSATRFPALEIELVHRWSTVTYKSMVTPILQDDDIWQTDVPQVALKSDFLLNGILAVSAFDIAHSKTGKDALRYVKVALEYQGKAVASYHAQLLNVSPDSQHAILYFSIILMVLALASREAITRQGEHESKVQGMLEHFELVRGVQTVMASHMDRIHEFAVLRNIPPLSALPRTPLDVQTKSAFSCLRKLNEHRGTSDSEDHSVRFREVVFEGACKKALFWLEECFALCDNQKYRLWALGWISMAGDDYIKAIKEGDWIARLILLFWGILIDPEDGEYWWATNLGKSLTAEILGSMPEDYEAKAAIAVQWARNRASARSG